MAALVIALLLAVATPSWLNQRVSAYDAVARLDLADAAMQATSKLNEGDTSVTVGDLGGTRRAGVRLRLLSYEAETGYCLSSQHEGSPHVWYWDSAHGGARGQSSACEHASKP